MLRSSRPPPRCSTVKAADGTTLTGESEIRARWAGYFEELYRVDRTGRECPGDVDAVRDADPLASCDPPTLEETSRAVNQLKSGKAPEWCRIYADMLRAGSRRPSLVAQPFVFHLEHGIIPTDCRRGVVVLI